MRRTSVLLLLLVSLTLSGCIFFRLSRVIVQMKYPEKYIDFKFEDGRLKGELLEPIAYLSDLEYILGQKAIKKSENHFIYRFKKEVQKDRTPWHIEFWTNSKGKVNGFRLPRKLGQVFGEKVLVNAIKSIGYAEVSARKKTVYLKMQDKITKKQISELMGKPAEVKDELWKYEFKNGKKAFHIDFKFSKQLEYAYLYSNGFNLEVTFDPDLRRE